MTRSALKSMLRFTPVLTAHIEDIKMNNKWTVFTFNPSVLFDNVWGTLELVRFTDAQLWFLPAHWLFLNSTQCGTFIGVIHSNEDFLIVWWHSAGECEGSPVCSIQLTWFWLVLTCGLSVHPSVHVSVKSPTCFGEPDFPLCPWGNIAAAMEPPGALLWYAGEGEQMLTGAHSLLTRPNAQSTLYLKWPEWSGLARPAERGGGAVRETVGARQKPMRADVVSENMLVFSRIHQILKAFLPSYWSRSACGQMGVVCERAGAKRLASKTLQGYCSRLTVHCSGTQFTWCYTVRDFLFHMIMYILDAAPLSWFVMLLSQANTAAGTVCVRINYSLNASGFCLRCIHFSLGIKFYYSDKLLH